MTQPAPATPTTEPQVREYLGLGEHANDGLGDVVGAVNALVARWRPTTTGTWPADVTTGATMLAARVWRRRNSPAGVETFGELGPLYVQRNDPDIAMLLGLGNYLAPRVG
ncbi:head-tail connector protein [Gordonia phage Emperor]|uniref:Head-to-tail adaptor n=2 Tax=root TaxID=1 RepID=A0A2Z4Q3Z1_9CAUD|nr:hypothetical protein [Gordonia westfalica]YP_010674608.1 head-tail connector protein [Gordonia phage Emperor]AWY04757.1 hypothetical protein PBI_EMPEROR_11 [Gordonia phage Emperor]SDU50435.1 hypothetical protein SAMN04488548_1341652 [Gordonia westfalica]